MGSPRECPCHSGLRYTACCGPFHAGARTVRAASGAETSDGRGTPDATTGQNAPTPEALMRSRYSAFALGLGAYLEQTLAQEHEDRRVPRETLVRELSRNRERQRFMGLRILESTSSGEHGEVLFYARIFERGVDCSFVELSRFVRENGAWRYAEGRLVPISDLPRDAGDLERLDRARFLAIHATLQG